MQSERAEAAVVVTVGAELEAVVAALLRMPSSDAERVRGLTRSRARVSQPAQCGPSRDYGAADDHERPA